MTLTFYPSIDDAQKGGYEDRIELLMSAAERYKAAVLDVVAKPGMAAADSSNGHSKRAVPRDLEHAFNWDEIAIVLREVRDMPEGSKIDKKLKASFLLKLADVYEVLRGAKMSKLEAVRLALINESNQLLGGSTEEVS